MLYEERFFRTFKAVKRKPVPQKIVAFDSEDDTHGTPLCFAFYDGKDYFYTTDADEAIKYIYNYPGTATFVAHNLEYDLNNLFKHTSYLYTDTWIKTPRLIKVTLLGSAHTFINSQSFFPGSVEKMGKLLNMAKLAGEDRSQFNPAYVKQDARIVWEYMDRFQKKLNQRQSVPLSPTIGSISMNVFMRRFLKRRLTTYINPELERAYYGGRVEVFHKGYIEDLVVSDINSSYPNVMRNRSYPDTGTLTKSSIRTHEYGVGRFRVQVPKNLYIPVLPYRTETGRLFFPTGTFEGFWCYAEVRHAQEHGCKILKEYDGVGTNISCAPFVEFVDEFYNQRLIMKERLSKNKADLEAATESEQLKGILNNLYGKFFQHHERELIKRRPASGRDLEPLGDVKHSRLGPFHCYKELTGKPARTANYLWALYVTTYARLDLHRHMMSVERQGGKMVYCDTDSVMYKGSHVRLDIGNRLGQLDRETYDLGVFRQAKGYLLCEKKGKQYEIQKVACKGVPTAYAYDFIIEGMAEFLKPMRFREALISLNAVNSVYKDKYGKFVKEVGANVWGTVSKAMRSIYIKRTGEARTYPVDVKSIPALEANVYQESSSIQSKDFVIKRGKPVEYFTNVKIPKNWFKNKASGRRLDNTKDVYIRPAMIEELEEDAVFFSGIVHNIEAGKFGRLIKMDLCELMGEVLEFSGMPAYFPLTALKLLKDNEERLVGNKLTIVKTPDDLRVILTHNEKVIKLRSPDEKKKDELKKYLAKKYGMVNL